MSRRKPPAGTQPAKDRPGIPTPDDRLLFPCVAIGGSPGGIEAIASFLHSLPADTKMAFVVVQHLSPAHHSTLSDILNRSTSMPVSQIENNMPVEPNHV